MTKAATQGWWVPMAELLMGCGKRGGEANRPACSQGAGRAEASEEGRRCPCSAATVEGKKQAPRQGSMSGLNFIFHAAATVIFLGHQSEYVGPLLRVLDGSYCL